MKKSLVCLGLLLTAWFSSSSLWAAANIDHLFALSLEELLRVKVTGSTLTPKELKTVPAAVTVFTHKQITNLGLESLDELMNLVPGFQSYRSSQSSLSYPYSSRGRIIGNSAAEILILVDGMRLAGARTSGAGIVAPKYPLLQIERVEFIRGPGSAVYGSNAMMGVVNIITRSGVNEAGFSVGSFERRKGYVTTSKQTGHLTFDLFAALDTDGGDDYSVPNTFGSGQLNTQDPREIRDLNVKIKWRDTQMKLHHNQFKVEDFYEQGGVSNGFNQRKGKLTIWSLQQGVSWQSMASNISLDYTRSGFLTAPQLTAPGELLAISSPNSGDVLLARANFNGVREARFLWHNDWTINPYSSLQFGFEQRQIEVPEITAQNNFDLADLANLNIPIRYYGSLQASTVVQASSSRGIMGWYGQYQHSVFDTTHLTLGLRHDNFSHIGSQLSPRFALVHELSTHHSFKLLYGEAFRAPAEGELNLLNNPLLLGNPDLAPETVQSSELIWLAQWPTSGMSVGYFESRYKDAIVQIASGDNAIYDNVQQDPSKGIELEVTHQLTDAWLVRGTYTDIFDSPGQSFRESDQMASLMINFQQTNWNANLVASYQGEKSMPARDSNGERLALDGHWLLLGKLRYYLKSQLQVFIQGKNLLDNHYLTPATTANLTTGVPNRGREILTGISFEF